MSEKEKVKVLGSAGSTSKVNGLYSGQTHFLHPNYMEIRLVVFVLSCWQTDQQIDTGKKNNLLGGCNDEQWADI